MENLGFRTVLDVLDGLRPSEQHQNCSEEQPHGEAEREMMAAISGQRGDNMGGRDGTCAQLQKSQCYLPDYKGGFPGRMCQKWNWDCPTSATMSSVMRERW
jgi:hypothetical protein